MSATFYNNAYPLNLKQDNLSQGLLAYGPNDIIDFKLSMRGGRCLKAGSVRVSGNIRVQKQLFNGTWTNVTPLDRVFMDQYAGVQSCFRNASTAVNGAVIENIQYLPRICAMHRQANYTLEGINTSSKCLTELCGSQNNYMLVPIDAVYGTSFSFAPDTCINKSDADLGQSKFQELRMSFNLANSTECLYTTLSADSAYMLDPATGFANLRYSLGDLQCRWIEGVEVKSSAPVLFQTVSLVTQTLLSANSFFVVSTPVPYTSVSISFIKQSHRNDIHYNNNRCEFVEGLTGGGGTLLEIEVNGNTGPVKYPIYTYQEALMQYWKSLNGNVKSSILNAFQVYSGDSFGLGCSFVESVNDRVSFALTIDPNDPAYNNDIPARDAFIYTTGLVSL
jgi:hypothetical protein